jgi:hypothetical protein
MKNHEAEETANGKVGTPNPYGCCVCGWKTLDEKPIPRGRSAVETPRVE